MKILNFTFSQQSLINSINQDETLKYDDSNRNFESGYKR